MEGLLPTGPKYQLSLKENKFISMLVRPRSTQKYINVKPLGISLIYRNWLVI